ncbi:DNA-protecting protein DprA [Kocuria sp. JC486]|uniref:DNA-protecting protein DprA n=1 Tax=Kocuria soli TaxID=2485125 RepID=A0A3N3ZME2_9MICC|nr:MULTISPECIES: DNA-processing protein DprA [Kocuria]NHU85757.1 DNA-protecting protein DprA [Kocuria sp. JC486]ROZ61839.1 DNA-protecting protein DprA [Kocuria soli]
MTHGVGRSAQEIAVARAGLSTVLEPRDLTGHLVLAALGPCAAWEVISGRRGVTGAEHDRLEKTVREHGAAMQTGVARAAARWKTRAAGIDPAADLARAERIGIWQCTPEDDDWPDGLRDLGLQQPVCLWGRGQRYRLSAIGAATVAVVGSRDCSSYGRTVTFDLAGGLATRGWTVISGGAYGVDEAAHRAALAAGTAGVPTVAVMAGGVDRLYPRGNQELLHEIVDRGLVLSEAAPGTMPARFRFLDRNRLIAALATAALVTESRWRSGAQSTAHHANDLSRPVGAVPGSVQSATSAGCHRLIREGAAVLVTDIDDFLALAGPLGAQPESDKGHQTEIFDGLDETDKHLADALPVTSGATVDSLAKVAGLPVGAVLGGLRRLERAGLAIDRGGVWVRPRRR